MNAYPLPMRANDILRGEIRRRGLTHAQVAERVGMTEEAFTKKVSRNTFGGQWFVDVLAAIGVKIVTLE